MYKDQLTTTPLVRESTTNVLLNNNFYIVYKSCDDSLSYFIEKDDNQINIIVDQNKKFKIGTIISQNIDSDCYNSASGVKIEESKMYNIKNESTSNLILQAFTIDFALILKLFAVVIFLGIFLLIFGIRILYFIRKDKVNP
ncbi:hypothetical protein [Flammeovirga yaeyamensis]|nr:hypothetical protein [Flammeovirga yaeyamensis]NMF33185.1 hypothetical protein [Flammeovirga yaeyamensis]